MSLNRTTAVICAATLTTACGVLPPGQSSLQKQVVGTWRTVEEVFISGSERRPATYGERPANYLIYTSEGTFCYTFTARERPRFEGRGTAEQRAAAFSTMEAACGTYSIEDEAGKVRVTRIVHSDPNRTGSTVNRQYQMRGDNLVIRSEPFPMDGRSWVYEATYQRVGR